ncbi:MAG: peptide chain release factor N(5)-glutamine methyltransferase [Anaerolineae bacterium]
MGNGVRCNTISDKPYAIREALDWGRKVLQKEGIDSARLDAELLLAFNLGLSRAGLYAKLDRALSQAEWEIYSFSICRRAAREPVAYLTGRKEFYKLDFYVDRRVLIPRPETELLVEQALEMARRAPIEVIADVGTGSGAVAISLAVELEGARIYATDISPEALAVAALNCRRHGLAGRVRLLQGDLLAPLPEPADLIVANLPYIAREEFEELAEDIRSYEPRLALDGGEDGLALIRRLLAQAEAYLRPGGKILLEIGAWQGGAVSALARRHFPRAQITLRKDYAGLDRLVIIETSLKESEDFAISFAGC